MIKITPIINKIFLSIFLLISPVFAMEVDCDQVAELDDIKKTLRKPALRRSEAEYNLFAKPPYIKEALLNPTLLRSGAQYGSFAGFSPSPYAGEVLPKPDFELFVKSLPIKRAEVIFPTQTKELEEAIRKHTERIVIYIPKAHVCLGEQKEVCPVDYDRVGVLKINQLHIKHSVGSDRGYWGSALRGLMPFIASAQNLQKIILSHNIVEELLPIIAKKTSIFVDCSCAYTSTDTIYSQECLNAIRENEAAEIAKKYSNRSIAVLKVANSEELFFK
ncbi:MAG: hypothetical protein ACOH2E_07195 [Candidatus Paracaedibacter sp.]